MVKADCLNPSVQPVKLTARLQRETAVIASPDEERQRLRHAWGNGIVSNDRKDTNRAPTATFSSATHGRRDCLQGETPRATEAP